MEEIYIADGGEDRKREAVVAGEQGEEENDVGAKRKVNKRGWVWVWIWNWMGNQENGERDLIDVCSQKS